MNDFLEQKDVKFGSESIAVSLNGQNAMFFKQCVPAFGREPRPQTGRLSRTRPLSGEAEINSNLILQHRFNNVRDFAAMNTFKSILSESLI